MNYKDGIVELSMSMPEGLLKSYVTLLESLQGLFKFMVVKTKYARASVKAVDPVQIANNKAFKDSYNKEVLKAYDGFIKAGHPINKAISLSNSALKAQQHPWATYDQVFQTLRQNGRLKGFKQGSKGNSGVVSSETPKSYPLRLKK